MTATTQTSGITLRLPVDGVLVDHELGEPGAWRRPSAPITSRIAYAAAHVVPAVTADTTPGTPAQLDWDVTMAYRHELWSYGLGVAEAMDTAQRGMGLDWAATQELIARSGAEAAAAKDNVNLEYTNDPDATKQAQLIQAAIDKDVDGIADVVEPLARGIAEGGIAEEGDARLVPHAARDGGALFGEIGELLGGRALINRGRGAADAQRGQGGE